jgi:hypothetical protein
MLDMTVARVARAIYSSTNINHCQRYARRIGGRAERLVMRIGTLAYPPRYGLSVWHRMPWCDALMGAAVLVYACERLRLRNAVWRFSGTRVGRWIWRRWS